MSVAGVQRVTALILMLGGLLGGLLVVLGSALYAAHGGLSGPALEVHRAVRIGAEHPPEVFVSIRGVIRGLTARPIDPLAVVALGLVLLLATPVLGVAAAIPAFLREGDRQYAAIAGTVLSMLLASLLLAGGAG